MSMKNTVNNLIKKAGYMPSTEIKTYIRSLAKKEYEEYSEYETQEGINLPAIYQHLTQVYSNNPWVYAAVYAIANHIAGVPMKFYTTTSKGKKELVDRTHWLYKVFEQPSPQVSGYDFIEGTVTFLELNGNAFWEKELTAGGELAHLYLLRSDIVRPIPHPKMRVSGYKYDVSASKTIHYNNEEIIQIRYFNPLTELLGLSPMEAVVASLILDFWALANMKDMFKNGGSVDGILETDDKLNDAAYRRIKTMWDQAHKGPGKRHGTAILERGLKYHTIGMKPQEMEFREMRRDIRDEVLAAYGVPPIIVGITEKTPWANAKEQRKEFWSGTLIPKMRKIEGSINSELLPTIGAEGIRMEFDISGVEALMEDQVKQAQRLHSQTTSGLLTINEARRQMGYAEVAWGNTWWTPANLIPYTRDENPEDIVDDNVPEVDDEIEEKAEAERQAHEEDMPDLESLPRVKERTPYEYKAGDEFPGIAGIRKNYRKAQGNRN